MIAERTGGVLKEFGEEAGIEGLSLDERGYCCLFINDTGINLEIDEERETLFLYAYLGDLPGEGERLSLYETLLEANTVNFAPGGGTIGIDTEQNVIVLSMAMPAVDLNINSFSRTMEEIVHQVQQWRERLNNL
ncbi:MAG: type III secretion system chaperone [Thermodesulforhabdaceae bacterium]